MYCVKPSLEEVLERVQALEIQDRELLVLYVGESCGLGMEQLRTALQPLNIRFAGGVFPGVIADKDYSAEAILLQKYTVLRPPVVIQGLSTKDYPFPDFSAFLPEWGNPPVALTLVDGLTSHIGDFLSTLYDQLGNKVHFIGGGAGSLSMELAPCLFTNEGIYSDAALLCFLDYSAGLGVQHGWQPLSGPIVATRTDQNIIHELNWRPALEVYREIVEEEAGMELGVDHFFPIAKGYPFGMYRDQAEDIVRDPIATNAEQSLICVGEVPEHTVLHILKGEPHHLIESAFLAAQQSMDGWQRPPSQLLLVDCISRTLFLEDDFQNELAAVNRAFASLPEPVNLRGILTLGEISSIGEESLQFYNKTIVVGSLFANSFNA